jgi:hypothetical protein
VAVAFDAFGEASESTTDISYTHTPVGTPKGVVVYIAQRGVNTDDVATVTYGGVGMSRLHKADDSAVELFTMYVYFLGSGIPTGAQTVSVDSTSGSAKKVYSITVTATGDTAVEDSDAVGGDATNPSVSLSTTVETYVSACLISGHNTAGSVTAGAGYTIIDSSDTGNQTIFLEDVDTNPSAGSLTPGFTAALEDAAIGAVALKDTGGGGAVTVRVLGTLGVGT